MQELLEADAHEDGRISRGYFRGSRAADRPYKLLQQIDESGFGVVSMAEQEEPIRRRVALKGGVVSVDGVALHPAASLDDLEEWRLREWSPDGRWLAIQESVGRWEFWVDRDLTGRLEDTERGRAQPAGVHDELRLLASAQLRDERPDHSLQPTAWVHEAYVRLVEDDRTPWEDRGHFFRAAARAMCRILIDHARKRTRKKRGGKLDRVSLSAVGSLTWDAPENLLSLDEVLRRLEGVDARSAEVVQLRYFGGLSVAETAGALGCSERTVNREWTFARAWLRRALGSGDGWTLAYAGPSRRDSMTDTSRERPGMDRVKDVFHEILEAERGERERLLEELCADEPEFRAEVEELLAVEARGSSFLSSPTIAQAGVAGRSAADEAGSDQAERSGDRIGPYKLLQQIGEGGFGVVYMAEQEEPIRRRVALKVIKPGMDTKQVIARFEAERQALAMLDHPNIARVFDAGATPAGRPYFVMELVKGIPITEYCDEERLGAKERLALFAQVCGAVHHAHENGIIHRDLKPSNVLVTLHDGTPVPKVIDFGVAKAIRQKLTESTLFTEYNQFIGTPEYMAPEQAAYAGLDVDRRSDVYSLGALLYELLTGTTPFEARALRRAAHLEVLRILKEEEPPKPSTRVHTMGRSSEPLAKDRRTDPSGLAKLLRGDLDWIVMKALEKDRGRRYGSASELAADIGRYFEERPIVARPPSFGYKARKLLRRRRGPFAAAAVVVLALVGDVAYVGFQRSRMAAETAAWGAMGDQRTELLLTSGEGGESCFFDSGRPSPDGRLIALVDFCWGGVHVHDVEAGTTRRVTDNDYYEGVAWSPDGRTIMASVGVPPSLRLIDVETGASESLASVAGQSLIPTAWSPDADHFSARREDDDGRLLTVLGSLATGEAEVVGVGGGRASFSPDGRWMVYAALPEGEERRDLFVVDVATGAQRSLTEGPTDERTPIWSPDGRTILYSSESGMWALPVRDGRPAGSAELLRGEAVTANAWTRRGLYFTVANTVGRTHRIEVDPATGQATGNLSATDLPSGHLPNVTVAWAPDGQRRAVVGWSDGSLRIFDGGSSQSFPLDLGLPSNLWWGDDGREVLFTRSDDYRPTTVSALDVSTGEVRDLFQPIPGIRQVHVSSDLSRMLYIRRSEPVADGTRERELVVSRVGEPVGRVIAGSDTHWMLARHYGQPAFSPDGSKIVFLRHGRGGNYDAVPYSLWVVDADGTDERLLVGEPFQIRPPVWGPTGRMIAYEVIDLEEERVRLMVMSVEDGKAHEIWSFRNLEGVTRLQEWSPDGTWIGVTERVGRWELWVNRDPLEGAR